MQNKPGIYNAGNNTALNKVVKFNKISVGQREDFQKWFEQQGESIIPNEANIIQVGDTNTHTALAKSLKVSTKTLSLIAKSPDFLVMKDQETFHKGRFHNYLSSKLQEDMTSFRTIESVAEQHPIIKFRFIQLQTTKLYYNIVRSVFKNKKTMDALLSWCNDVQQKPFGLTKFTNNTTMELMQVGMNMLGVQDFVLGTIMKGEDDDDDKKESKMEKERVRKVMLEDVVYDPNLVGYDENCFLPNEGAMLFIATEGAIDLETLRLLSSFYIKNKMVAQYNIPTDMFNELFPSITIDTPHMVDLYSGIIKNGVYPAIKPLVITQPSLFPLMMSIGNSVTKLFQNKIKVEVFSKGSSVLAAQKQKHIATVDRDKTNDILARKRTRISMT